jgi:hypothetical protein
VFHRVDDVNTQLDAAVFFRMALRLPAYAGCLAAVVAQQQDEAPPSPVAGGPRPAMAAGSQRPIDATPTALRSVSEFSGLFDITELN